jgi:CheY-like chemotaxis protein/DNA-binding XRE family transcriptional regulator
LILTAHGHRERALPEMKCNGTKSDRLEPTHVPPSIRPAEGPLHQTLGGRLRLARRVAGMTQRELGATIGSGAAEIRQYEAGSSAISAATMLRFAVALDVPLAWLYGVDERDHWPSTDLAALLDDPELPALIAAYRRLLDDESRRLVGAMAKRLAAARASVPAPLLAAAPAARPSVLVVDDAPDALVLVGAFLRSGGYDMLEAADPDAALALLAGGAAPDVLVTDYMMPGMNGLELVRRANGLRPGLPAVMMTGFAADLLFATPFRQVAMLAKPFNRAALLAAVEAARTRAVR